MERKIQIRSYFSLETDLAGAMLEWPEFVSGKEYTVDLKSSITGEAVTVRYVDTEGKGFDYVEVVGTGDGLLFDQVLGRVSYELSAHSDNLMVDRAY